MRGHPCDSRSHHLGLTAAAAVTVFLLLFPLPASAAPPANDNRAAAEPIPAFPATIPGSTVEATIERLDPQVSQCGRVESTVWYRIDKAPDGTIVLGVTGASLAPVVRVYELAKSSIEELVCSSAKAGAPARVGFETTRGASYLVLVGKRAGTADAAFTLNAGLFLPPANDTRSQARRMGKLPATVKGSTLGATSDDNDPDGCRLSWGTVWYSLSPGNAGRLIVKLQAQGDLDASMAVLRRVRSETSLVGCKATDGKGAAVLPVPATKGATYLVVVGSRGESAPGEFTLQVLRGQSPERAPGKQLQNGSARGTLNGLTNVNDIWWVAMQPGSTYRVAMSSRPCVPMTLRQRGLTLRSMSCGGYSTFTPGPDGGGRYFLELIAPPGAGSASYRLQFAKAGPDDIGVGPELKNLATARGALAPAGVDVVDVFHFDVAERSDVRLRLGGASDYSLVLLTDSGFRLASSGDQIRRQLERGRYVLAVRGEIGAAASRYTLGLVIRRLTVTTLKVAVPEVLPGVPVTLSLATTPTPDAGKVKLQIDRFDPLEGWQFFSLLHVSTGTGSVSWAPPALGRWRFRAAFTGTLTFSPSRSDYALVLVAPPLPPGRAGL